MVAIDLVEDTKKMIEVKKKREKAEDFIGWKSKDDLLEVIGLEGRDSKSRAIFKVTCIKCSKDSELFPDGYFVSQKASLIREIQPCGCAKFPKWTKEQFLILSSRAGDGRFIVHGFAEEFHGANTKLNCECLKDGYNWNATIHSIINGNTGCAKCSGKLKLSEQEALERCNQICFEMGYEPIGFIDGYKNKNSKFEYFCHTHKKQTVGYNNFVYSGNRCSLCWKDRQVEILRDNGNGNGYYPERKDERDYLYIMSFNDKYIKVGRSFNIIKRLYGLKRVSKIKNIKVISVYIGTHQEIYDLEQELHEELRERNFEHYESDWSTETFENDCLDILYMLLDKSGVERIE